MRTLPLQLTALLPAKAHDLEKVGAPSPQLRLANKGPTILKSHFATSRLDWGGPRPRTAYGVLWNLQ
jgi:hypothetical protein